MNQFLMQTLVPYLAYLNLFLLSVFFIASFNSIKKFYQKWDNRNLIILILILVFGILIRSFLTPHLHIFLVDESFYIEAAKNIESYSKSFLSTGNYPKQIGWPILLTIPFSIFGANNFIAIYTSILFGSLSILIFYFLVLALFNNNKLALISAFLLAIMPLHVFYSGTAETVIASIFFIFATLTSFCIYLKDNDWKIGVLSIFLFLFTIQIRLENLLLLIPISILFYQNKIKINWSHLFIFFIISIPFIFSYIFQYNALLGYYDHIYYEDRQFFGTGTLVEKILLFDITLPAILLGLLILLGLFVLWNKNKKNLLFLLSLFAVYFGFFMTYFFAADFHAMPGLITLIPIAAHSIIYLSKKFTVKNSNYIILAVTLSFGLIYLYSYDVDLPDYKLEAHVISNLDKVPENCTIISEVPNIITSTTELRAIDSIYFLEQADEKLLGLKGQCVLFLDDIYCKGKESTENSRRRCKKIHENYELEPYMEFNKYNLQYKLFSFK